mgnify:CR=1 FL=1
MKLPPLLLERDMMIYNPWDAQQNSEPGFIKLRKTAVHGLTFEIYGTIGTSDLTGKPTIEDMTVLLGNSDVTSDLPESLLQDWVNEAIETEG